MENTVPLLNIIVYAIIMVAVITLGIGALKTLVDVIIEEFRYRRDCSSEQ